MYNLMDGECVRGVNSRQRHLKVAEQTMALNQKTETKDGTHKNQQHIIN